MSSTTSSIEELPGQQASAVIIPVGAEGMPAQVFAGRTGGGAILLVSDIQGPDAFYQQLALRLVDVGFTVLLPDFFFRQGQATGTDLASAMERRKGLDEAGTVVDLGAAADWLKDSLGIDRIGCLGFCMGGTFALDLASKRHDLVTCAYYGFPQPPVQLVMPPPRPLDLVGSLSGPVLAFWGDQDEGVGQENIRAYTELAGRSNPEFAHAVLPGLSHGFLRRTDLDDSTDPATATWDRAIGHFKRHLSTPEERLPGGRQERERPERDRREGARPERGGRDARGGQRVRLPRRPVTVTDVTDVTPNLIRVVAKGELADWNSAAPGAHVKIFLPDGQGEQAMRTYTVRAFDASESSLTVDFGVHADGPATRWARSVNAGDRFEVAGEARAGFVPQPETQWCVFFADHCALPAVAAIIEQLPDHVLAIPVVELTDALDAIDYDSGATVEPLWLIEDGSPSAALEEAAVAMRLPDGPGEVWIGCEAASMRRIRRLVLDSGRIDRSTIHPRAYWKKDVVNHSDHDTGED